MATEVELWAGVEPTINRVGDRFSSQLATSGHLSRPGDIDLFISLGIKALRQPLLWELIAPTGLKLADWQWADAQLARLREAHVRPIAGLMHHGSGPVGTSLIDPQFPSKLAAFAGACARRYPWVEDYTPINEPITTARFSTLYGLWYPHGRDDAQFARAVVNQCRATVLSMKAIREVNPKARLVQTDDAGLVTATPMLTQSARFENERRWLAFDLLAGRVDRRHRFWSWLRCGVSERELELFLDEPCPADVIGLNYYVTSDRTLDSRISGYPERYHGGNGKMRYADVESVRTPTGIAGHESVLMAAWERYETPVAITEVHLDCTREEQLRWLAEAWDGANAARARGADVRAVTAWSLLGSHDWNSLLTRSGEYYEPGAYDLRGPAPRPTAVSRMIRGLATEGMFEHPVLEGRGWWRPATTRSAQRKQICVIGLPDTLAGAIQVACEQRNLASRLVGTRFFEDGVVESVATTMQSLDPWAVIFVGAPASGLFDTAVGPEVLAATAEALGVPFMYVSNQHVFDGEASTPYVESDAPSATTPFGRHQAQLERSVLQLNARSMVVRTSTIFGGPIEGGFIARAASGLARGQRMTVATDELISPAYGADVARVALDLLIDEERGIWHLVNDAALSWAELAQAIARCIGADAALVEPLTDGASLKCFAMKSERARLMPSLDDAFARHFVGLNTGASHEQLGPHGDQWAHEP